MDPAQDSTETHQIEKSLDISEKILGHINESIREQEGRERLKDISQHLWIGQGCVHFRCDDFSSRNWLNVNPRYTVVWI